MLGDFHCISAAHFSHSEKASLLLETSRLFDRQLSQYASDMSKLLDDLKVQVFKMKRCSTGMDQFVAWQNVVRDPPEPHLIGSVYSQQR